MKVSKSLEKVKTRMLPPSSRSFHSGIGMLNGLMHDLKNQNSNLSVQLTESEQLIMSLTRQNEVLEQQLNDLNTRINQLEESLSIHDAHMKTYGDVFFYNGTESAHEMRKRFFHSLPPADEPMRTLQLANAKLLHKFESYAAKHHLDYWLWAGSIIGAASCEGPIPWDDDIDLCMMREDAMKLYDLLQDDPEYQMTLVYDYFVFVKQFRFSHRDPNIPCFIDVCIFDWETDYSKEHDMQLADLRKELIENMAAANSGLAFWEKNPWIFAMDSGFVIQAGPTNTENQDPILREAEICRIEELFTAYQNKAYELGIFCDKENATAVAYGLDNMSQNAPWRRFLWPTSMILPTQKINFLNVVSRAPHKTEEFCDSSYPGWPFLPRDILGHEHFSKSILKEKNVLNTIKNYIDQE